MAVVDAWVHAYTEAVRKGLKQPCIQTRRIFDLDGGLLKALPKQSDRTLLRSRISQWLSGLRRGKLRLPDHFPQEVRRITELSKTQVRRSQYWMKSSTEIHHRIPRTMVTWLRKVAPSTIWATNGKVPIVYANSVGLPRLNKREIPRNPRTLWPPVQTFSEMLYCSRTGKSLPVQDNFKRLKVFNHLSPLDVHKHCDLATRIVRRNVVGIRFEMEVPRKFLRHFRYRDGFLILTVRHCLPIGLVRFLLSQWIKCPNSLWLLEQVRFKTFLKRKRFSDFIRDPGPLNTTIGCVEGPPKAKGKASSAKKRYQKRLKAEKRIDQAFAEKFGLDPALF